MSSICRGVTAVQTDCLICNQISDRLLMGLCIGCHISLRHAWSDAPAKLELPGQESEADKKDFFLSSFFGIFPPTRKKKRPIHEVDDIEGIGSYV